MTIETRSAWIKNETNLIMMHGAFYLGMLRYDGEK